MRMLLALAATLALSAGATACGGDSSSADADIANAYVEAAAQALCVVQSNAYATQAEQEAAYRDALQSELSADELAEGQAAAAEDEELRTRISDAVAAQCG